LALEIQIPAQARPINALTVDVEDYFHVAALSRAIDKKSWDVLPPRVDANTRRLLDIFDEHATLATFFVLGWVAERFPALVAEIAARNHEVACHGLAHQLVYEQSPEQFREETTHAKKLLEDITGRAVVGYRAASYSITEKSKWALDILLEAGFEYDSSVVPVHHDLYGMPGVLPYPHRLATASGAEIVEFPPSTVRVLGQNLPIGGGGYFRLYPYPLTSFFLRRVTLREGRPVMFYIHPWEIDPEQPRVRAGWFSRFRHYNNLDRCEDRLHRLLAEFEFGSALNALKALGLMDDDRVLAGAYPAS
jgi:polysaccharide deacetylase family protein (PEP-CTERM system associated)